MFVFVASVHHTGTQFVQKLFEDSGYKITDKTPKEAGNSVNYLHRCHITDSVMTELMQWLHMGIPIIVPLRHPKEVARSWLARNKPLTDLVRQFKILEEVVDAFTPLYLPIDHYSRETALYQLQLECEPKLHTDWPVVGSRPHGEGHYCVVAPTEADYEQLKHLRENLFLQQFYQRRWPL